MHNIASRKKLTSYNQRARIFGVIFHEDNRDILPRLIDRRAKYRCEVDDPSMKPDGLFHTITSQVNDVDVKISHPKGWNEVIEEKRKILGPKSDELELWTGLDPNEMTQSQEFMDPVDLKTKFRQTMSQYKETMRLWTMGTGGGSGSPADYCCWQTRSPETFKE